MDDLERIQDCIKSNRLVRWVFNRLDSDSPVKQELFRKNHLSFFKAMWEHMPWTDYYISSSRCSDDTMSNPFTKKYAFTEYERDAYKTAVKNKESINEAMEQPIEELINGIANGAIDIASVGFNTLVKFFEWYNLRYVSEIRKRIF